MAECYRLFSTAHSMSYIPECVCVRVCVRACACVVPLARGEDLAFSKWTVVSHPLEQAVHTSSHLFLPSPQNSILVLGT